MPRHTLPAILLLGCALAQADPPPAKVLERYRQMLASNPIEGTALDRLWQAYADEGKTAELLGEYEGAANFAGEMVLGHLLRKALRPADAAAAYRRATALDPQSPLPPLALAQLEKAEGRHTEAAKWLAHAVELLPESDPRKIDTLLDLGAEWLGGGDAAQAAAAWERTAAIDPQNLELRRRLADSYVRQNLGERAIPHLEFITAHAPPADRALAWQQLAGIHQAGGRQDAAIDALVQALSYTAPENWLRADLQSQLIRLHQRYHRTPELEQRWKRFAAENPRDLGAYLQLVELYARLGDHPQELAWLEKLVALAPKNAAHRLRLARLLVQMDQVARAAKTYDELLAADPRNAGLVFERARLDIQRDQPQAAGERVVALVAADKADDALRSRALEFYEAGRLFNLAENQLVEEARTNADEPLLALANFYFARRREGDAQRALERLVRAGDAPQQRAAAHFKAAQVLKLQNEVEGAVAAMRAAIALQPGAREYHFLLGELEAGRGNYPAAQEAFERAVALSGTSAEAQEADQRLYESLRSQQPPGDPDRTAIPDGAFRPEPNSATSAAAQGYLLKLLREAVEHPTVEAWLRVARWQMWSRNTRGAIDAADRALAVEPGSVATHEFLAKLHEAEPQTEALQKHLRELMRLDPANRLAYLRRIGQAELQAGRTDEALRIFSEAAGANPGNPDALADLALAQERAEHWNDALDTLKKVYALSPSSRRREAVNALLRVEDRLAMKQAAAELLLAQLDAEGDGKDRSGLFQELLMRCTRDGLLDWLRTQFDTRHKNSAGDYFTEMALGRILKAQGNKAAAFEVLADAALSAPDPAEALPELVHEAEELRKLDAAIDLQARLVQIVPQDASDSLVRLARLQEKNLQPEKAALTWERIVARFPRDLGALEGGVEFQVKWGTPRRALEWLRRICTLEPGNARAWSQIAALALDAGQSVEASAALEQVLAHTPAEKPGEPIRFPAVKRDDSSRLQAAYLAAVRHRRGRPTVEAMQALRGFWLEETPNAGTSAPGEREVRQHAIRDLGQLVAAEGDAPALAKWTARWQAAGVAPGERLLALYAAGASGPLLDEVAALLAGKPGDPQTTNAFIWLALQTGEFGRLAAWLQDRRRTSAERDYLMVALDRYLDEHAGQIDPALVERVFPPTFRPRLRQTAEKFSQRGHFREAAELGQRVFDGLTTRRAEFGASLAAWYLNLGEIESARAVLRASLDNIGESFDAPVYAALRALYRLLPDGERAAFAEDYARTLDDRAHPLHAAIARTVLADLRNDEKAAHKELERVIDLHAIAPTVTPAGTGETILSATRYWNFILNAGAQLQAWHSDSLARFVWERALADSAWISLQAQSQGDQVRQSVLEVRTRLAAVRLAHAEPFEFDELLGEFSRSALPETVLAAAEALENAGANPRAIEIYRRLWESDPNDPHALRNLLNACRTAEDFATLGEVLTRVAGDGVPRGSDATQHDLVLQLADVLEHRNELAPALRILAKCAEGAPRDARLGLRLAQLEERAGHSAAAEAAYRRVLAQEPGNTTARLALAGLLDAADQVPAAVEFLERTPGVETDARLAPLLARAGRLDEAVAALERLPPPSHVAPAIAVANAVAAHGENREARLVLRGALNRSADAQASFPLQSRMIELLPDGSDAATVEREVRRLRKMAAGDPELLSAYFDLIEREAARLKIEGEYRRELAATWDEGRGMVVAGGALLDWQLHHEAPAAAATWAQLLARPDFDAFAAEHAAVSFHGAQDGAREIEALARLARLDATPARLIDWARALEREHRHGEAVPVLEELAARAVLQDEAAAPAARACAELGLPGRARELFAQAAAADPAAQHTDLYLDYARLLIAQRDFNLARTVLRTAFRNPANREAGAIANWLVAAGRGDQADAELPIFGLTPQMLLAVRRALFAEFEQGGNLAAAVKLLEEHSEVIEKGMCARVRAAATRSGAYGEASTLLERLLAQSPLDGTEPSRELALLLVEWVDAEPGEPVAVLARLKRACELQPALWPAASRLSRLQEELHDLKSAARTLRTFIDASRDTAEIEKARQLLSRMPAS